jgi:hypothetical protein
LTTIPAAPAWPWGAGGQGSRALKLGFALAAGGILFGLLAGGLIASGHTGAVFALAVVLLPVALWRRPQLGPVVLLATALLIEQLGQSTVPSGVGVLPSVNIPITSNIPLFAGIGSVHIEPADLLLLMVAVIYLARTGARTRYWPHTHVTRAMGALLGMVVLGIAIGLAHHGSLREALMEARPFVYLAATYLLTAVLIRTHSALRTVLWAFVLATGVKALQGIYVFLRVRNMQPRPESVIGHEAAYFFAVFMFLVAALWLFDVPGRLRTVATWLLPFVIAANLFNDRRAAWLLLGAGLLALGAITYRWRPSRRTVLRRTVLALLVGSAIYFPIFWNQTGSFAQLARAVHSQISPDPRDAASDLYRTQENANLILNIKQGGLLGKGFGVPIDYALPIVNITNVDPEIAYVPHNGVLYVLMRMGILGAIAMWALLGTAIVAGCRLARSVDREVAVVGALLACSLIAYALEGATDLGFSFYRIAFVTGTLLGLGEAARRLRPAGRPSPAE